MAHRWLREQGIDNIVVDSASIEVNRRARRAKTDRLDGDKLLAMLLRHDAGERVWSVLHEPTAADEDARRAHRELERLLHERIAHTNRIGSLLVLHNLRPQVIIGGRDWAAWWERHRAQVPPLLGAEIQRESARLALVKQQIMALDHARRAELAAEPQPLVAQLTRLRAIGPKGAWVLVKEVFGWRRFANRRELAGCLGLVPTPYASGDSQIDQGISKAGNRRARALLVELAWRWLSLQPTQRPDRMVQPALRHCGQTHAAGRHRGGGAAPGDRAVALPAKRRDPGRRRSSSRSPLELGRLRRTRLAGDCIIMIKGRRARGVRGSLLGDRPQRWGAPLTGVGQRTMCACWIGWRTSTSVTDRSSSEPWLERSLHPGLRSGCNQPIAQPLLAPRRSVPP